MKRALDILLSASGLVLAMPALFVLGLLVVLTSSGPALYWQKRVGLHGKHFTLCKFRTMVTDADRVGSSVTVIGDPRVTAVGCWLRKTKLDELPQLWNVLRGDMSIVGPRPDVPDIIAGYTPNMMRILDVRPGITSIASLKLSQEQELLADAVNPILAYQTIVVPAKVELAMQHVLRDSLLFDMSVLLRTAWALTLGRLCSPREDEFVTGLRREIAAQNRELQQPITGER